MFGQIISTIVAIVTAIAFGPVLGNLVSQGFNNVIGTQNGFSWKSLGMSVLTAGVSIGLGNAFSGVQNAFVSGALNATTTNLVTQGLGLATGLQKKFDWAGVAAAGVSGGLSRSMKGSGMAFNGKAWQRIGSSSASNLLVSGLAGAFAGAGIKSAIDGSSFGKNLLNSLPFVIGSVGAQSAGIKNVTGGLFDGIFESKPPPVEATSGNEVAAAVQQDARTGTPPLISDDDIRTGIEDGLDRISRQLEFITDPAVAARRQNGRGPQVIVGPPDDSAGLGSSRGKPSGLAPDGNGYIGGAYGSERIRIASGGTGTLAGALTQQMLNGGGISIAGLSHTLRDYRGLGNSLEASISNNPKVNDLQLTTLASGAAQGLDDPDVKELYDLSIGELVRRANTPEALAAQSAISRNNAIFGAFVAPALAIGSAEMIGGGVIASIAGGASALSATNHTISGATAMAGYDAPALDLVSFNGASTAVDVIGVGAGLSMAGRFALAKLSAVNAAKGAIGRIIYDGPIGPIAAERVSIASGPKLLPGEGLVGTADDLLAAGFKGDNLTPHHIPSANRMSAAGVKWGDGIAINMEQPLTAGGRHRATFTYGTQADINMTSRDALAAGVWDARRIYRADGLYTPQIRSNLQELILLNRTNHPPIFVKPVQ